MISISRFIWTTPAPIAAGNMSLNNFIICRFSLGRLNLGIQPFLRHASKSQKNWAKPEIATAIAKTCPFVSILFSKRTKEIIRIIFNKIGAEAIAPNLPKLFRIPPNKATSDIGGR